MQQPEILAHTIHAWLAAVHWIAGLIVLAEGLNKLERTEPLQPGLSARARVVVLLKVAAWVVLVLGAGGALVRPLIVAMPLQRIELAGVLLTDTVSLVDLFFVVGFAVLILRSRLKE